MGDTRRQVAFALDELAFELIEAATFAEAIQRAASGGAFTGVLLSVEALRSPGLSVATNLQAIRTAAGTEEVVVLFGPAPDIEIATHAIRQGIAGFVRFEACRCDVDALRRHVSAAAQRHQEGGRNSHS